MNILLIGSGGREHALAWAIARSPRTTRLFAAPGNAGIAEEAECIALDTSDAAAVIAFCKAEDIGLVVVGPEAPLVAGLVDALSEAGIRAFGPNRAPAALEGSKGFTKDLCARADIPTAAYGRFTDAASARAYVEENGAPIVVKADGLAAGKGVVVAETVADALAAVDACFDGAYGDAGAEVVVEECLVGEEASLFVLCDGTTGLALASAQDHKRVGDGDTGPNTGGMGAYSPAPVMDATLTERAMRKIVQPTLDTLRAEGMPFTGILYAGLMITADGPKLIEYNVRFGDPECQVLMMRLTDDIVALMEAAVDGRLSGKTLSWRDAVALTVVLAAKGYPGAYEKGSEIRGLDALADSADVKVFHAGTTRDGDRVLANGGRVLNVTALGKTVAEAQARAYAAVGRIDWPDGFCRTDIGWRAVAREEG